LKRRQNALRRVMIVRQWNPQRASSGALNRMASLLASPALVHVRTAYSLSACADECGSTGLGSVFETCI
jgi:hypothetical protein